MTSPAKRRKINKHVESNNQVRPLDFFFNRQRAKEPTSSVPGPKPDPSIDESGAHDLNSLTDEQLARQLQDEWNREDGHQTIPSAVTAVKEEETSQQDREEVKSETSSDVVELVEEDASAEIDENTNVAQTKEIKNTNKPIFGLKTNTLSLQSATAEEDTITNTVPFDQSPLTFEPAKYISDLQKQWAIEGGSATYALLTRCFILINSTQSRIKIVDTLVNLLRVIIEGDPESLLPAVSVLSGMLNSFSKRG